MLGGAVLQQIGQLEAVNLLGRVGEVGVYLESVQVADHQERRILQVLAVLEELLIRGPQVFVPALVLPGEVPALPHVGKAMPAKGLGDALLKGVACARLVGLYGMGLAQHLAEVAEVRLRGGALAQGGSLPAGDKLRQRQRRHGSSSG